MVGIGVVGIALESPGVTLDRSCRRLAELLDAIGQLAEIDLERRQREAPLGLAGSSSE